jgi:GNAT superfamily N-acetyltransferase
MSLNQSIEYRVNTPLDLDAAIDVYRNSTLGVRRPLDDRESMAEMFKHANLIVSAWDGEQLVGLSRAFTDYSYVTYVSDLVVRDSHQRKGIGKELIRYTQAAAPKAYIVLLAAPLAADYYEPLGFEKHDRAWVLPVGKQLV